MGIAMMADTSFGETEGGLQAPSVLKEGSDYYMFFGTWEHIAVAESKDGKTFARQLTAGGKSGLFGEGPASNTRDPEVIKIGSLYYIYYTACLNRHGFDFARTSRDLLHWSKPTKVAYGGSQGSGCGSAECPFVYYQKMSGYYYLLRNQFYGKNAQFSVYRSKDPLDFGRDNDRYLVETMPYAAPEVVDFEGETYLAVLLPNLKGIQVAKLKWAPK
jgi:beta-xylosidase